jgi:signal peptidase I
MKIFLREFLFIAALAVLIFLLIHAVIQNCEVFDISMQPTLVAGQRLIVLKVFYTPERGDIVIVRPPIRPDKEFVKRLIGLPGDTVEVKNETVYINGLPVYEPYVKAKPAYSYGPYKIPDNNYFVLGDNRNNSSDSHSGWTVTRQEIIGKACLRYWPFSKWGSPGNYTLNVEVTGTSSAVAPAVNLQTFNGNQ